MNKPHHVQTAAIGIALLVFFFSGCPAVFAPDAALPAGVPGSGELIVYFEGFGAGNGDAAEAARTLLPENPVFTS
jgi:hypothetical protein